jgi:hypothetical protein
MNLREFIHYYRACPLCHQWITMDADLSIPCSLEIEEPHLLFKTYEEPTAIKEYRLGLDTNQVHSDYPFIFNGFGNQIQRLLFNREYDHLKIEARCYTCNNFRYWSNNMQYNSLTKCLTNIGINGERLKMIDGQVAYTLSTNYKHQISEVFVGVGEEVKTYDVPFTPFPTLNFPKPKTILTKMKNLLLLS